MKEIENALYTSLLTSAAALVSDTLFYPLEVIMTQLKISKTQTKAFTLIKTIYKTEKINGLYKGINTLWMESILSNFGFFLPYEILKNKLYSLATGKNDKYKIYVPFVCSFISDSISMALYLPATIIKTRMQSGLPNFKYKNFFSGYLEIVKTEGFLSFYKTSFLVIMHELLHQTIFFGIYENIKLFSLTEHQLQNLSIKNIIWISFIASVCTNFITNPIDTFIRNYQIFSGRKTKVKMFFIEFYQKYGLKGFHRGVWPNMLYGYLSGVIIMSVYEKSRLQCKSIH